MYSLALFRWGVPQDAPSLVLISSSSDLTPDFVLSGDLAVGDTVRFEYGTDPTFSSFSQSTNTIDAGEDAANLISFSTGALTNGQTYYFRSRIERPPRGITAWSNTESVTFNLGGYTSLFGFWFGGYAQSPQISGGYFSMFGRHLGGFGASGTARAGVGRVRRRRTQTLEEFEAAQPKPFGRKWFEEFKAAELAAKQASETIPNARVRTAISRAVKAAENVKAEVELSPFVPDLAPLLSALHSTALLQSVGQSIKASQEAVEAARKVIEDLRREQEDEEEAIMLLLH